MATTQDESKKEKDQKLLVFDFGDKARMGALPSELTIKLAHNYKQSNF